MSEHNSTHYDDIPTDLDLSRVHFVGIGGAGMSGLAKILLEKSATVSGSDMKASAVTEMLNQSGAQIALEHSADNLRLAGELPTVVVTSFAAIPANNPELVAARELQILVIRRSDLLAELMRGTREVLIAGTHGKTSTTSMSVVAMREAGLDPSFAIGGQLTGDGTGAHWGGGEVFIAEADESDASLLSYRPDIAVVTNIEPDHLDFFGTAQAYLDVFDQFVTRLAPGGTLVACMDDPRAAGLADRAVRAGYQVATYGTVRAGAEHPHLPRTAIVRSITPTKTGSQLVIDLPQKEGQPCTVEIELAIPGEHMALNATAALLAGYLSGGDLHRLAEGLSNYTGVRRRFEFKGEAGGVRVFDDYAHHPTEVAAAVRAARATAQAAGDGQLIVVFQPHLYSRTMAFATDFAAALSGADSVILMDIYGAREQPVEGVSSALIGDEIALDRVATSVAPDEVAQLVAKQAHPGDVVVTMGAGDVTEQGEKILAALAGMR